MKKIITLIALTFYLVLSSCSPDRVVVANGQTQVRVHPVFREPYIKVRYWTPGYYSYRNGRRIYIRGHWRYDR